jgi:hypothetical protein
MKAILAVTSAFCAFLFLASCENCPYKPVEFTAPLPPPPPNAFVSIDSLSTFVGSHNVKLAYTKSIPGGNQVLYFADFNDSAVAPQVVKKPAGLQDWSANCPIISPDGNLVAYYLTDPSNSKHAAAYCQKLDANSEPNLIDDPGSDPHFYKDNHNHLYITYADTTDKLDATHSSLRTRHTYEVQIDTATGQKIGTKDSIAPFPFYGGMSYDGKYICTGFSNAYIFNTVSQNFFSINPPLSSPIQTCNPSMTPDSFLIGRMMFLNIGGVQNMKNMPASITQGVPEHQYVFVADTDNTLISSFSLVEVLPSYSSGEWQCPKWTNVTGYFCALATKSSSVSVPVYDCFIVSMSTKKTLLLNLRPDLLQFNGTSKPYVFIGAK